MEGEISMLDGGAMEDVKRAVERFSAYSVLTFTTWVQHRLENTDHDSC